MTEESDKITIGFHFVDTFANTYDSRTTVGVFYDLGDTDVDTIGRQLNIFLKQCGYFRQRDLIFMEDIDEDEYDALAAFLAEYREGQSKDED